MTKNYRLRKLFFGFTFVELLIVTTIIAILASVAIPRFYASYERFRLRVIARNFELLFKTGHELSILEGRIYKLSFSKNPSVFALFRESNIDTNTFDRLTGGSGRNQYIPSNYQVKSDHDDIFLYPDGSSTISELVFLNHLGNAIKIQITLDGKIIGDNLEKI